MALNWAFTGWALHGVAWADTQISNFSLFKWCSEREQSGTLVSTCSREVRMGSEMRKGIEVQIGFGEDASKVEAECRQHAYVYVCLGYPEPGSRCR